MEENLRRIVSQLQVSLDEIELEVMKTPTSEKRNDLTDSCLHIREAMRILSNYA